MKISLEKVQNVIQMHYKLTNMDRVAHGEKRVFSYNDMLHDFKERMLNSTLESEARNAAEKRLVEYMMSFTHDEILDLEALMDYGRSLRNAGAYDGVDQAFISDLRNSDPFSELLIPSKYISQSRRYFENMYKSPEEKTSAIHYMIEKGSFPQYLQYALTAIEQLP